MKYPYANLKSELSHDTQFNEEWVSPVTQHYCTWQYFPGKYIHRPVKQNGKDFHGGVTASPGVRLTENGEGKWWPTWQNPVQQLEAPAMWTEHGQQTLKT